MTLPNLRPSRRLLIDAAMIALMVLVVACFAKAVSGWKRETTAARVETSLAGARQASAREATEIVVNAAARDDATDRLTQENTHAIRSAPGAALRLDPGLNRAGLAGLCRRAAYRGRPECLQFSDPVEPPPARPRR